jgi:hypothetical protein
MQSLIPNTVSSGNTFLETLRLLGGKLLPHNTKTTTCPPAPLVSGEGPLIVVASLMRSGTHLLLDSLFNNVPKLRRKPLFVDFDAYERGRMPVEPLQSVRGMIIKTHYPETPLAELYVEILRGLASKAVVLTPRRSAEDVRRSLAKWGVQVTPAEFAEVENRFAGFWTSFAPTIIEFPSLLNAAGVKAVLSQVALRTGLECRSTEPVMPARSRFGVYVDKTLSRLAGYRAPRINTTIGYRLSPRQRA